MHRFHVIFLFIATICPAKVFGFLPSYINACPRNISNMAGCMTDSINSLRHIFETNDFGPGFEDIPTVEPFLIESIFIGNRDEFSAHFSNIYAQGGSKFQIEKLKANMRDLKFDVLVRFPRLDIKAQYDINFSLFGFSLKGHGDFHGIVDDSRGRISMRGKIYMRDGKEHLHFDKVSVKIQIVGLKKAHLSNLFGPGFDDSAVFQDIVNTLLQTQPEFVLNEINPPIERSLSDLFTRISNKITTIATFDEMFPV